jgi:glycosyltransferase involved in cell wall biosynthesis
VKLNIVGGERSLIETYQNEVRQLGLEHRVAFHGMQRDVRPFLWAADLFMLPSVYEVFPLVVLEAAAAGTPILATPLNGVEDFITDGENGLVVERSVEGVRGGIERYLSLTPDRRAALAARAQNDVVRYSIPVFQDNWRRLYERGCPPAVVGGHPVPRHRL